MESPIEYNFFLLSKRFDLINGLLLFYIVLYGLNYFVLINNIANLVSELLRFTFPFTILFVVINLIFVSRNIKDRFLFKVLIPFGFYGGLWFLMYKTIFF